MMSLPFNVIMAWTSHGDVSGLRMSGVTGVYFPHRGPLQLSGNYPLKAGDQSPTTNGKLGPLVQWHQGGTDCVPVSLKEQQD